MRSGSSVSRLLSALAGTLLLGTFGTSTDSSTPAIPLTVGPQRVVATADVDGDGRSDTVLGGDAGLRIRLSISTHIRLKGPRTVAAAAAVDLDRDGDRDLIALSTRGRLFVWRNDGAGRFSLQPPRPRSHRLAADPEAIDARGSAGDSSAHSGTPAPGVPKSASTGVIADRAERLPFAVAVPSRLFIHAAASPRSPPSA